MRQSSNFELSVIRHGSSSKQFYHEGKYYVEGKQGDEFSVKIKNNTNRRVFAVLTVDGLSAMDGKTGSFDSTGYILDSFNSITVPGWRLSNKEVAHFEFARSDKSYAAGKGKGIHNGVIGCAFFYEKQYAPQVTISNLPDAFPHSHPWWEKCPNCPSWPDFTKYRLYNDGNTQVYNTKDFSLGSSGNSINTLTAQSANFSSMGNTVQTSASNQMQFSSASGPQQVMSSSLGTGFGDRTEHRVVSVGFERASETPTEVLTVYYDTRQGLKNRGIAVDGYTEIASPFPGSQRDYDKYCEPPQDWND